MRINFKGNYDAEWKTFFESYMELTDEHDSLRIVEKPSYYLVQCARRQESTLFESERDNIYTTIMRFQMALRQDELELYDYFITGVTWTLFDNLFRCCPRNVILNAEKHKIWIRSDNMHLVHDETTYSVPLTRASIEIVVFKLEYYLEQRIIEGVRRDDKYCDFYEKDVLVGHFAYSTRFAPYVNKNSLE